MGIVTCRVSVRFGNPLSTVCIPLRSSFVVSGLLSKAGSDWECAEDAGVVICVIQRCESREDTQQEHKLTVRERKDVALSASMASMRTPEDPDDGADGEGIPDFHCLPTQSRYD